MKNYLIIIYLFIGFTLPVVAENNAGAFIEKSYGPRPIAMGSAFTGVANDGNAIYLNPAGLTQIKKSEIEVRNFQGFETVFTGFNYTSKWQGVSYGIGFQNAVVDDIQRSSLVSGRWKATGDVFAYRANAGFLSVAKEIIPKLSLGGTVKYIYEKLDANTGTGVGIDAGMHYQINDGVGLGIAVQNVTPTPIKWNTDSGQTDTIPRTIRGGTGILLLDKSLLLSADISYTENRPIYGHAGVEYWLLNIIPLRAGLDGESLSMGTGLHMQNIGMDVSWVSPKLDEIDDIYRFSIKYQF